MKGCESMYYLDRWMGGGMDVWVDLESLVEGLYGGYGDYTI